MPLWFIAIIVLLVIATFWILILVVVGSHRSRTHDSHVSSQTFRMGFDGLRLRPRTDWHPDDIHGV